MISRIISFWRKYILFLPLILYSGERSLIAYDEGIYVLQAKWILENNDWIAPMKWGSVMNDRTIGIQFLIALSQKMFGENLFAAYIPNIIFGSIMIYLTYELHKVLTKKAWPIISSIILCTTFLWINYFHMATQDMIFGSITTLGIFGSIKAYKTEKKIYFFIAGLWIGLAVMLKTYLVFIPLIAILPFLYKQKIYNRLEFWIGLIIGFLPFSIWSVQIISQHGWESFKGIYEKLLTLSGNNEFSNPIFYYAWNFTLNLLPWTFFSILGFLNNRKNSDPLCNYFLFKYPLIVITLLSVFSTKTPYYPIQILSITSINAYLGISSIFNERNFLIKFSRKILFILFPISLLIVIFYTINNQSLIDVDRELKIVINISIIIFSICWLKINNTIFFKRKIILLILGPYLMTSLLVQSGFFNDRSKEIRIEAQSVVKKLNLADKKVEIITSGLSDENSTKTIIKLGLFMPHLGNGVSSLNDLEKNQYAWKSIKDNDIVKKDEFSIVYDSKNIYPWKLVIKK